MSFFDPASLILTIFIIGYIVIIYEIYTRVNKAATAIFIASTTWLVLFSVKAVSKSTGELFEVIADTSQIIFFLLAAMTLVEVIDAHRGFQVVSRYLRTRSKPMLLILTGFVTFFLSAVLDNLTTMILMISILRKLIPEKKDRLTPLCLAVIAANAGGAWTPIGDVTTTMLWIQEKITTAAVISNVFFPSIIALVIPLVIYLMFEKGVYPHVVYDDEKKEPRSLIVLIVGIGALILVPILKAWTGLPPFLGILLGLSVVWFLTDLFHHPHKNREHLRITYALTRIDASGILFFLGILLSVEALSAAGLLKQLATFLSEQIAGFEGIAAAIGIVSAVVDNVPIVAATIGMYSLPVDHPFWLLVAYTAGTGGSIFLIGSAAGVALMGIEKIDFLEYLKRASLPAFLGYVGGILIFLLQR
ncbi:MAG: sodium:proton antiporter [Chlamydiae bacterium]|nr:sodium:proton antiporter [Chlamydiota bacterium]